MDELKAAHIRLARNADLTLVLTAYQEECIAVFKSIDATTEQIDEAHRRYLVADELMHRITTHGKD